ncbi:MAG: hypothetical protein J5604_07705 [Bacteroidales bacterium]|nr:hypothetical protein [Bacteroidales bacterium]
MGEWKEGGDEGVEVEVEGGKGVEREVGGMGERDEEDEGGRKESWRGMKGDGRRRKE